MKKMIVLLTVAAALMVSSFALADGGDSACGNNPYTFGCPLWHPSR